MLIWRVKFIVIIIITSASFISANMFRGHDLLDVTVIKGIIEESLQVRFDAKSLCLKFQTT